MIGDDWTACKERRPLQEIPVMTKTDDYLGVRNVQVLTRRKRRWYKDGVVTDFYPTHWRYLREGDR